MTLMQRKLEDSHDALSSDTWYQTCPPEIIVMPLTELFQQFKQCSVDIIPNMIRANATSRDEMIDVISDLAAELQEGLDLVSIYLRGAKNIDDANELRQHLQKAQSDLLRFHSEFKICRGLRKIRDRFHRLFDSLPYSINLGQRQEIESLLYDLQQDERLVIEEFSSLWHQCYTALGSKSIEDIHQMIDDELAKTAEKKRRIGEIARNILQSF